jgi:hypothetical protein
MDVDMFGLPERIPAQFDTRKSAICRIVFTSQARIFFQQPHPRLSSLRKISHLPTSGFEGFTSSSGPRLNDSFRRACWFNATVN